MINFEMAFKVSLWIQQWTYGILYYYYYYYYYNSLLWLFKKHPVPRVGSRRKAILVFLDEFTIPSKEEHVAISPCKYNFQTSVAISAFLKIGQILYIWLPNQAVRPVISVECGGHGRLDADDDWFDDGFQSKLYDRKCKKSYETFKLIISSQTYVLCFIRFDTIVFSF